MQLRELLHAIIIDERLCKHASAKGICAGCPRHYLIQGSGGDLVSAKKLLLLAAFLPVALAGEVRLERTLRCMGTEFTVDAYGPEAGILEAATEAAFEEAERLDQMLSNYRPDSELTRVNRNAAAAPVPVSKELFDLLELCDDYSRKSEGSFDMTVGPLMQVWGFYKGSGHLPHQAEVRTALDRIGYAQVQLDRAKKTVHFSRSGLSLDPGGVGKGYAVDRMAAILRTYGIRSALVSGGSSSVYAIGTPPGEPRGWYTRIRDPRDEHRTAAVVYLKNNSVSTSGNYEKFFWAEGKLYSHIMDPRTGRPSQGMLAVSVISPKTLDSEVWAKPYYILGREWARTHRPSEFRVLICEDRPGAHCEWLQ